MRFEIFHSFSETPLFLQGEVTLKIPFFQTVV